MLHRIYSSEHNRIIHNILNVSNTLIACDKEDEDHIFGYVVAENVSSADLDIYHYIYIKAPFQKKGIATELIENSKKGSVAAYSHKNTRALWISDKLLKNYKDKTYNPYLFFKGA